MDTTPAYLIWFLIRIRSHGGEPRYLVARFADMPMDRMLLETQMLRELYRLGYVALPEETEEKVYNPLVQEVSPGVTARFAGTQSTVPYPHTFEVLPKGHYALREIAFRAFVKGAGVVFAAIVGVLVGVLIAT